MTNPAETIPCTYCGAKPNQPCTNKLTGQPLTHWAAHQKRITDTKHTTDDEVPF